MKYKYIHFALIDKFPKTSLWACRNTKSGNVLGHVRWHGPWRQYCYFPTAQAVYSAGCLDDIKQFIDWANTEHKKKSNND